jgi:D-sedoheptulose 7-phosphate isomerase
MMNSWANSVAKLSACLGSISTKDDRGRQIPPDRAFRRWRDTTLELRADRGTVYLVGNGASASMASHVAADLAKNAHVHTEVFSDLSLITAIANDVSYEEVFAEPLRRRMRGGDVLVAVSSSGESPNILRAAEESHRLGGAVVTLTAMDPDNSLRRLGTLNFYVPAPTYGMAESCHAAILHHWIDHVAGFECDEATGRHTLYRSSYANIEPA